MGRAGLRPEADGRDVRREKAVNDGASLEKRPRRAEIKSPDGRPPNGNCRLEIAERKPTKKNPQKKPTKKATKKPQKKEL
jgi:hypothetical protein